MFKILQKTTALVLVIITMFSFMSLGTFASYANSKSVNYDDQISLCWDNVISTTCALSFTNAGKISATITIAGKSGTKYKNGTIKIQRYSGSSWVNVKTWSNQTGSTAVFSFSNATLTALSNTKYRLTIQITAYNGSSSEVINLSKTSTNS